MPKMDSQAKDGGECDESDQFSESFVCCVCLDLLYKPIVLSCGHISCFWCIHHSMNGLRESQCPMCRHPYYHFPTVCKILHAMLLKMYPVAYKRRENQTLEKEKETGVFSPQYVSIPCGLHPNQDANIPSNHVHTLAKSSQPDLRGNKKCANDTTKSNQNCNANIEVTKVDHPEEENFPKNIPLENHRRISLADVQCDACSELLFRPVVVNCGHVYCEPCIINLGEGKLTCQVCQSILPRGSPKVCLELDFFVEKEFSYEYSMRKATLQHKKPRLQHEGSTSCSTEISQIVDVPSSFLSAREYIQLLSAPSSKVHAEVGCDCCEMHPIIGDRYKCRDCVESIGFDLCGECYKTPSKLPGRFNQQHTLEHRLELIDPKPNYMREILLRQLEYQPVFDSPHDASENQDNADTDVDEDEIQLVMLMRQTVSDSPPPPPYDASENQDNAVNDTDVDEDEIQFVM